MQRPPCMQGSLPHSLMSTSHWRPSNPWSEEADICSVLLTHQHTLLSAWYCGDTFVCSCKLVYGVHHCFFSEPLCKSSFFIYSSLNYPSLTLTSIYFACTFVPWPLKISIRKSKHSKNISLLNWARKCFMYLASMHRCSYPGSPHRWRCWSRVQSGTAVAASHSVCRWRLCESSHSCSWDHQGFRHHMNEFTDSISSGLRLQVWN